MNLQEEYSKKKLEIIERLKDFKKLNEKDLFYELCFCLLTPQSKAKNADYCIKEMKKNKFLETGFDPTSILKQKIRFHNNKGKYLLEMRVKYSKLKDELSKVKDNKEKREFLVKNVKGIGLKEAAHYLRNTGHENLAILDRHILNLMVENKLIKEKPKSLTNKTYFEIENKFRVLADKLEMSLAELDLYMWYMKTGEILK